MEVLSSVAEAIETVRQTMEVISLTSGGHFAKYWGGEGGGGEIFNMYAFGVGLRYANRI